MDFLRLIGMKRLLFALFLAGISVTHGQDDPDWLYQDGFITYQESLEWRENPLDSLDSRTRISTQSDTGGQFRKPEWASKIKQGRFHAQAKGDSSLRSAQIYWQAKTWTCGGGHWTGKSLSLPWPDTTTLGSWCEAKVKPLQFGMAGGVDSSGLLAMAWNSPHNPELSAGWWQSKHFHYGLVQAKQNGIQAFFLTPVQGKQYTASLGGSQNYSDVTKLRWKATRNQMDTATKSFLSRVDMEQRFQQWVFTAGNRWMQYGDTLTEWIALTKLSQTQPNARWETSYSIRSELLQAPSQFLRIGAEWGPFPLGWRGIGIVQWQPASQPRWQYSPQLESGFSMRMPKQSSARFTLVLPKNYRQSQQAQFRARIEGPCTKSISLQLRWSMNWNLDKKPPISRAKTFFSLQLKL